MGHISSCQGEDVIKCRPIHTQCACSWCHYFHWQGKDKFGDPDAVCAVNQEPQWSQRNHHYNCPYSCVCGHNYDALVEARRDTEELKKE